MTDGSPFYVVGNNVCRWCAEEGRSVCFRALCRECASYVAFHCPTVAEAEEVAARVHAELHHCHPFGTGTSDLIWPD